MSRYLTVVALGFVAFAAFQLHTAVNAQSAPKSAADENLDVRYTRAMIDLAEANLAKMNRTNERTRKSIPADIVAQYQQDLDLARLQLSLEQRSPADPFSLWLGRAEAAWKTADRQHKTAVEANRHVAGSLEPLDIERLRLRAAVAQLNWRRGRALRSATREQQLEWTAGMLYAEVTQLNQQLLRMAPSARYVPIWPY